MAAVTGKRKRQEASTKAKPAKKVASEASVDSSSKLAQAEGNLLHASLDKATSKLAIGAGNGDTSGDIHLQIVTGSYERLLHGLSARIPRSRLHPDSADGNKVKSSAPTAQVSFSDNFLFAAHASAVRCLAISPPTEDSDKRYLATGSSDERINVYSLSTAPPHPSSGKPNLPSLTGNATAENPRNRSLGSLIHHDRAITKLHFPSKSKLFSAAEDSTIAISRTRDWTVLSSMKAPIPKPQGRPSGDTAGPGEIPAGINDFGIHPSQKIMISVGRGEKSMRLWNLMTGKKAAVLAFDRSILTQVGEGKFSSGEGRRILWDDAGEHFVVGFERGAVLFNIDSVPQAIIKPSAPSKVHQMRFLTLPDSEANVLALSTEDGRILFFGTDGVESDSDDKLPIVPCVAQIGGREAGVNGRVKDFEILPLSHNADSLSSWIVVAGSSDGALRLWSLNKDEIIPRIESGEPSAKEVGHLIAMHETGDRITCLGAFVLDGKVSDGLVEDDNEAAGAEEEEEDSKEDSDA